MANHKPRYIPDKDNIDQIRANLADVFAILNRLDIDSKGTGGGVVVNSGSTGATGIQGLTGLTGAQGPTGPQGPTNTILQDSDLP